MNVRFSRRKMMVAGGAALITPSVLALAQSGSKDTTSLSAADREITFITGSDNHFITAVENLYPGLGSDSIFQKIAPLAVLLTHKGGPGVRAYSISWEIIGSTGGHTTALFYYSAPGSKSRHKSLFTMGSARQTLLQSGDSILVTPFFTWSPMSYHEGTAPNWKQLLSNVEPGDFLLSELATTSEVKVSVDGVIFSDWKILGPDKHGLAVLLSARRDAEHDEGVSVHRLLKAGADSSTISETLKKHGSAQRSSAKDKRTRYKKQFRRFQAQVLLRHFEGSNAKVFKKALLRLIRQRRTIITKVGG